jgi:hypothetical protein
VQWARPLAALDARLGVDAKFRGVWRHETSDAGSSIEVAGRLEDVDLNLLVGRPYGVALHGPAQIEIERLAIAEGRVVEIAGAADGGPGAISAELLSAAATALELRTVVPRRDSLVRYERLSARFELRADGLWLAGDEQSGALLADDEGHPLLAAARTQPRPAAALAAMLSPSGEIFVPANPTAAALLRWLPLPVDGRGAQP